MPDLAVLRFDLAPLFHNHCHYAMQVNASAFAMSHGCVAVHLLYDTIYLLIYCFMVTPKQQAKLDKLSAELVQRILDGEDLTLESCAATLAASIF
jgi:hypothetical protein